MTSRLPLATTSLAPADIPLADGAWVTPLLDTTHVAAVLQSQAGTKGIDVTRCLVKHIRYRPGATCTVLYEMGLAIGEAGRSIWVYGKATAPGRECPAPWPSTSGNDSEDFYLLPDSLLLPNDRTAFYEFPADPMLKKISWVSKPEALGRAILTRVGLLPTEEAALTVDLNPLRYKPEHRLILRVGIAQTGPSATGARLWDGLVRFEHGVDHQKRQYLIQSLQEILGGQNEITVPEPELYLREAGCSVNPWKPGKDLARLIRKGKVEVAQRAGHALACIHRLPRPDLPTSGADEACEIIKHQVEVFHQNSPARGLADHYSQAFSALAVPANDSPVCLVHGDYHQGQLLAQGTTTCILDWDRAHLGDAMEDFGRFQAQIHLLEIRGKVIAPPLLAAFAKGYRENGGVVDPAGEVFWTGLTLIDLGLREVRRQRPGWNRASRNILDRAQRVSRGGVS